MDLGHGVVLYSAGVIFLGEIGTGRRDANRLQGVNTDIREVCNGLPISVSAL